MIEIDYLLKLLFLLLSFRSKMSFQIDVLIRLLPMIAYTKKLVYGLATIREEIRFDKFLPVYHIELIYKRNKDSIKLKITIIVLVLDAFEAR